MRKLHTAIYVATALSAALLLGACQTPPKSKAAGKEADIETLQKATALANGNLAWEIVHVSDIRRDATSVKWLATTRSLRLRCAAQPDGSGSYCEPETAPEPAPR